MFTTFKWNENDLLTYCVAGSCSSRFGRVGVLSWQTSNGALSISVTKRRRHESVCVCVGDRGWLDIHVALIIVPLLPRLSSWRRPGFDVGLIPRDSWMLG